MVLELKTIGWAIEQTKIIARSAKTIFFYIIPEFQLQNSQILTYMIGRSGRMRTGEG